MKTLVQTNECVRITATDAFLLHELLTQFEDHSLLWIGREDLGDVCLDSLAQEAGIENSRIADLRDDGSTLWTNLEQPLIGQFDERLADRPGG